MSFCPNCGAKLADGMKFCTECGTKLAAPAPVEPVYEAPVPAEPVYEAPAAPVFEEPAPAAPVCEAPAAPVFEEPAPAAPVYEAPVQQTYTPPVQQSYEPPVQSYTPPVQAPTSGSYTPPVQTPTSGSYTPPVQAGTGGSYTPPPVPPKAEKPAKAPKEPKAPKAPKEPKAPRDKKPGNKKLIPIIAGVAVLVVLLIVLLVSCGGKDQGTEADWGRYEGVSCTVSGMDLAADGEWVELQKKGKATLNIMGTEYAAKAEEQIAACRKLLAQRELFIGDVYWSMDNYEAAWTRYRHVAQNYPDAVEEAEYARQKGQVAYMRFRENAAEAVREQQQGSWKDWFRWL